MNVQKTEIRRMPAAWRILLCSVFFCVFFCIVSAAEENGTLAMSIGYGYRNTARSGQMLPVTVYFANGTGEEVRGFLSVEVPGTDTSVSYTQAVAVPEGESSVRQTVSIPDAMSEDEDDLLLARFFDDAGEEILSSRVTVTYTGSGREVLCGILTDDPSGLRFFGNVSLGNGLNTRAVTLNPADMPEDRDGFSQLDIIAVSGFDMKRLSTGSVSAVMEWVSTGGTLILGTGNTPAPLGAFSPLLKRPDLSYAGFRKVDMGMQYSASGPDGAVLSFPVRTVRWEQSEAVCQSSDCDLMLRKSFGKGNVCIAAFDFGSIAAFCTEHPAFMENILTLAIGPAGISRLQDGSVSASERMSAGTEMTNIYEESSVPGIRFYLIAAVLFVFLAGTGLFRFLFEKGLGIYYQLGVLITAMAFSLLLWFCSGNTRFTGPFLNAGMICSYSTGENGTGGLDWKGYIRMESPSDSPMTLELPVDCTVRPVSTAGQISVTTGKTKMLAVTGQKKFEPNYFLVEGRNEAPVPLQADLKLGKNGPEGQIENTGDRTVEGLTFVYRGQFRYIGLLEPGQTVSIEEVPAVFGPVSDAELVSSVIIKKMADTSRRLQKQKLLAGCIRESAAVDGGKVLLLGFSGEEFPFFLDGTAYPTQGSVLIAVEAGLDGSPDAGGIQAGFAAEPRVISGEYDRISGCILGSGTTVLEYSLGSGDEISALNMYPLSEELEGERAAAFSGEIAMYNYESSSYDRLTAEKTSWTERELKPYLSPANNLTLRYIPAENTREGAPVWVPVLYVRRARRNDAPESVTPQAGTAMQPGGDLQADTDTQPDAVPQNNGIAVSVPETVPDGPVPQRMEVNMRTPGER